MKTAFLNAANKMEMKGEPLPKADMAASFRYAVVSALVEKAMLAANGHPTPPRLQWRAAFPRIVCCAG